VAIIFSPVDGAELDTPYIPRPRHAFLMLHAGETVAPLERQMIQDVRTTLGHLNFQAIAATEVSGTGDFLGKIVDLVRGCGFGVAVYSDQTPAKTLGNIFFEVGISHLLGKPVQLLIAGADPTPSDFVRTEWLRYEPDQRDASLLALQERFLAIERQAEFYFKLGEVGLEADTIDFEMTAERFKQAVLIGNHPSARRRLAEIAVRLRRPAPVEAMTHHRRRLRETITHFLRLLPDNA
jgi:hypothetical protein